MKNMKKAVLVLLACPLLAQAAGSVDLSSLTGTYEAGQRSYSGGRCDIVNSWWPNSSSIANTISLDVKPVPGAPEIIIASSTPELWTSSSSECTYRLSYTSGDSSSGFNFVGGGTCVGLEYSVKVTASLKKSGNGIQGNMHLAFYDCAVTAPVQ